jgi:Zn-dependent M28 family amino/carboxypeptidase
MDVRFDDVTFRYGGQRREGPGELRLVVQNGRQFQERHPAVPVLVDKGRYLLVDVAAAPGIASDPACFGVFPVAPGSTVFRTVAPPAAPAQVPWIRALVDRVAPEAYAADLRQLTSYPTRHSTSASFAEAAAWAAAELGARGFTASVEPFTWAGGTSANVVAVRAGTGSGDRGLVYATAHLDSVNHADGPGGPAPGADDNASGAAGLLQIARVLSDQPLAADLRLVLFGGEEQGLHGSRAYVAALPAADRRRVAAVVNMDMIGVRNTVQPAVLLEGAPRSQALIDGLAAAAAAYTTLEVQVSLSPYASDHVPFLDAGLPAVLTIEGADGANTAVHTAGDTLDRVDTALAAGIARMNVAYVASVAG